METSPTGSEQAAKLFQLQIEAQGRGDNALAAQYRDEQLKQAVLNQGLLEAQGLPESTPIETSGVTDPEVEIYRQFYGYMEKQGFLDQLLERHDFQGMGVEFDQMVMQPYKARNAEDLVQDRPGMSDEERIRMMQQLEPVIVDPNWIADMRQRLVKLDIEMKGIDPNFSVYKNPKTKRLANWMARETGPLTPGYLQSGEQGFNPDGETMGRTMAFAEAVPDFGLNLLWGAVDLSAKAIKAIAGEEYGLPWAVATNYVEDENGNLVNNGGKVPGFIQTIAAVNARVLDQNVREYVARVDKAREFENLNLAGFDRVQRGIASVIGMGFGFGLPAGAAMHTGKAAMVGGRVGGGSAGIGKLSFTTPTVEFSGLLNKGLLRLAASGASPRMVKLTKVLAGTAGAMVGNGLAEGIAFGRAEGYDRAFVHGMAMAPVLMGLGALGRKAENVLLRKKASEWFARPVAGALEGVGFGTLEAAQVGALWKLLQDPSNETWEIYAKNMLGFAIFKGAFGRSVTNAPEFGEGSVRQLTRQQAREGLAEEVSRSDERALMSDADRVIQEQMAAEGEMRRREAGESEQGPETEPLRELGAKFDVRGPEGEQIKGTRPSPEAQMEQASRGELQEGEIVSNAEVSAKRTGKQESQGRDPLEDPNFMQRPEAERRAITEAGTAKERRQVAESFEGPERRQGERRADVNPTVPSEVTSRLSPKELAAEVQRLRAAGPTPENRARIIQLLNESRGMATEGALGEVRRQVEVGVEAGERAPVGQSTQRPRETAREAAETERPLGETTQDLEARVEASGVPREILRELGDISRARRAARSPQEARKLWRRQLEIEQELDALEMSQDPVMNATMREALREMEVRELDTTERELEAVDPGYGERPGPESMRSEANPHRQQENLLEPGELPVRASDIINELKGRPGFPGVRLFAKRFGKIKGSAVQVAIRSGRIAGRGTAGVFKLYENLTRTKEGMDLVVALHEWSHAMQRQVQIGVGGRGVVAGNRKWIKSLPEDALLDMGTILRSYPGAGKLPIWGIGAEAWAEWHARNLLGDATLRAEVPHLSREMDAWLAQNPDLLPQYQRVMEMVDVYKRQGARLRMRESVIRGLGNYRGTKTERTLELLDRNWDRVVKSLFDDMHLLKKSQRKWLEVSDVDVADLSILDNPARMYDTLAMTAGKRAEAFIRRGTHNLHLERTGESLEEIMNSVGKDLKGTAKNEKTIDFIDYVVSTRAIDLIGKGKKQTLPLSDYLQTKKELLAANPEFAGVAERLKVWTDALLDLVAEAGNLPKADVQRMKDYSVVYLPFVRAMDGVVTKRGPRGVAEKGNAIKSMKGDTREIQDPMQAMFETTTTMIAKAQQYMVMKSLYKMMLRADVGGLATRVDRTNVPSNFRFDQVLRQMQKSLGGSEFMSELQRRASEGEVDAIEILERLNESFDILGELAKSGELSGDMVTLFGQKLMPFGEGANIIAYTPRLTAKEIDALPRHARGDAARWNGKMQWLEVDEHAYTALMGIDQPTGPTFMDNAIMKVLFGYPKKAVRFFATDANPAFVAANAIRDIMSAPVFDREGRLVPFGGFRRFFEGAAILMSNKPENRAKVDMYEASGAKTASIYNEGVRREMRGEVIGKMGQVREAILKATGWWTGKMAAPESFIRIQEFSRVYDLALEHNKSKLEASMEALEAAKEITVNFARAGTIARLYNQMTPYFSASFAGQRKLLRAITGMEGTTDKQRAHLQTAALANAFFSITVPTMAAWAMVKDEDWYKDLPEWRKRNFVNMRMPGSSTVISLPLPFELGTIFGAMPQIIGDHITDSNPINFLETFAEAMFPYLRGVGSLLPAGAKPILEAASGYDFFTQRELTPYYIEQNNPPPEQIRPGTTTSAQGIFRILDKVGIDYFLDNPIEFEQLLSGYTAGASTAFMRWVDETAGLKDHPGVRPGIEATYGTFLNRFAKQTVHGASRTVDEFYNDLAPDIEQRSRSAKTRTPQLRRAARMIQRDKDRMSDIRAQVRAGEMSRAEGDRLIFEIARDALEREGR